MPFAIVPPVQAGSVEIPAVVPDLLGRDLLQPVAPGPLQKCFVCFSHSLGPRAPGVLLFIHPSVCIRINFFE